MHVPLGRCLLALFTACLTTLSACTGTGGARASAPATGAGAGFAGGGVVFAGSDLPLEQVQAMCRQTGKPAMLYFSTSWCGYCRKLERETLPSPIVGRHMAGYVNVRYDGESAVGRPLAQRFGVRGFPSLVRIDASGTMRGHFEGFDLPADFVRRIPAP